MPTKSKPIIPSQIKSKARVKERGEVFTAEREVKAMCDLIPEEVWRDINATFLEPACGNGNFLVEIFERKLKYSKNEKDGLKALASIYGLELLGDNVLEARNRLFLLFIAKFPAANKFVQHIACLIIKNNIIQSDTLETFTIYEKQGKESVAEFMRIAKEVGRRLNGGIGHHR